MAEKKRHSLATKCPNCSRRFTADGKCHYCNTDAWTSPKDEDGNIDVKELARQLAPDDRIDIAKREIRITITDGNGLILDSDVVEVGEKTVSVTICEGGNPCPRTEIATLQIGSAGWLMDKPSAP